MDLAKSALKFHFERARIKRQKHVNYTCFLLFLIYLQMFNQVIPGYLDLCDYKFKSVDFFCRLAFILINMTYTTLVQINFRKHKIFLVKMTRLVKYESMSNRMTNFPRYGETLLKILNGTQNSDCTNTICRWRKENRLSSGNYTAVYNI